MAVQTQVIEYKGYNISNVLSDEVDALDSFSEYDGNTYICDAISEIADRFIPIYNSDIWENASDIQDYIEEAISSGIVGVEGNDIDLMRIFQAGYYGFYTQILYNNLDMLAFNYVALKVNEALNGLDTKVDLSAIEEEISNQTDNQDNNDSYSDLEDIANSIIEDINENVFNV